MDIEFQFDCIYFQHFNDTAPLSSGLHFRARNLSSFYLWIKCDFFPLVTFKICSAFLVFSNLIMMKLDVVFIVFILLVIHWTFWLCGFIVSTILGPFLVIISSDKLMLPHPHLFFWNFNYTLCVDHLILFYRLLRLCSFLFQSLFWGGLRALLCCCFQIYWSLLLQNIMCC